MSAAKPRMMSVREFRARCLEVLAEERNSHVVVKSSDQPLARVVPITEKLPKLHRPSLAKYVIFTGDIESPIDVRWNAVG